MRYFKPLIPAESQIEVKKSRFIGQLYPIETKSEAGAVLNAVKEKYRDASHNCWAYRIGAGDSIRYRSSDEGEPAGTAGRPILESLEEKEITDTVLIITRYFGGIKLGIGGLNRAYRQCARETILQAKLKEIVEMVRLKMHFLYCFEPQLRNRVYELNGSIERTFYSQNVLWEIEIPKRVFEEFREEAVNLCRGQLELEIIPVSDDD
ncbi:YigZ family protein [bacterium]|nr:YigZ family protein [bacterium]